MQFIVKILTAIVPYILRFIDRHSDEYLALLNKRISKFLGDFDVATVKFFIINEQGESVKNAVACFYIDNFGDVQKKATGSFLAIKGFKAGKVTFEMMAEGYKNTIVEVVFEEDSSIVEKTLVMKSGTT